nr:hypothetical protein KPHV_60620 [Kitasatospora purpeofusca]
MFIKHDTWTTMTGATKVAEYPLAAGNAGTQRDLKTVAFSFYGDQPGRSYSWECELCGTSGIETDDDRGKLTAAVQRQTMVEAKRHADGCTI